MANVHLCGKMNIAPKDEPWIEFGAEQIHLERKGNHVFITVLTRETIIEN
jgi:hypothetical protein